MKSNRVSARNDPVPFVNLPYDLVKQLHFPVAGEHGVHAEPGFPQLGEWDLVLRPRGTRISVGYLRLEEPAKRRDAVRLGRRAGRAFPSPSAFYYKVSVPSPTAEALTAYCPSVDDVEGLLTVASEGSADSRSSSYPRGTQCLGCERYERGRPRLRTAGHLSSLRSSSLFSIITASAQRSPLVLATQK